MRWSPMKLPLLKRANRNCSSRHAVAVAMSVAMSVAVASRRGATFRDCVGGARLVFARLPKDACVPDWRLMIPKIKSCTGYNNEAQTGLGLGLGGR